MRRAFVAFAISVGLLSGCTDPETRTAEEHLGLVWEEGVSLAGRSFVLGVMKVESEGSDERTLSISGDGLIISFHASGRPERPTISGSTITFGPHTFEVTPTKGSYVVDGTPINLTATPRTAHIFSNGAYHGTRSF